MILQPIIIGPPDGRYCPAWLSLDGRSFGCRWNGCKFKLEDRGRVITHDEMREHARTHGVEA